MAELKQFVPSAVCLACDGCCRFSEANSCWRPRLAPSEKTTTLPGKKGLAFPASVVDDGQALQTIPWQGKHICYFFHSPHNTCGVYPFRPFECRFYPFVVTGEQSSPKVSVHLACPYVQEKRNTPEFTEYVSYLKKFFGQRSVARFLQSYLTLDHAYAGHDLELEELFAISADLNS